MKFNDFLSGALVGASGAAIYLHARTFPPMPGQDVGPHMFPQLIAVGMMVCAALLLVRGLRTLGAEGWISAPDWLGWDRVTLGFIAVPLALVFYVAASESLGFIPTSVLMLMGLFLVFEVRLRMALVVALIGSLGIHYVFYKLLKVPLPWGILRSIAW